jgi:hypothetical protein
VLGDGLGLARDGSHEDQAATDREVLVGLAGHEELTAGVDVEDAVKLLGGDILDVTERHDTRVGADNVELAESLDGLLEETDDLVDIGHVGLDGDGVGAVLLDLLDDLVGGRVAVGVVDNDLGAATSKLKGHLATDTTASTRHKGDLALERGRGQAQRTRDLVEAARLGGLADSSRHLVRGNGVGEAGSGGVGRRGLGLLFLGL